MLNTAQIQAAPFALPVNEQLTMLDVLEGNVIDKLAEEELRRDVRIVEDRLAELDIGPGILNGLRSR